MPWYDLDCPKCGVLNDEPRSVEKREICPECGGPCSVLLAPTRTVGIVFSNAQRSNQLGVTWNSNKEKRDWMKAHPNVVEMTKGDANERAFSQQMKQDMHDSLKKQGMSMSDYKSGCREAQRKEALAKGTTEKKIALT